MLCRLMHDKKEPHLALPRTWNKSQIAEVAISSLDAEALSLIYNLHDISLRAPNAARHPFIVARRKLPALSGNIVSSAFRRSRQRACKAAASLCFREGCVQRGQGLGHG